MPPRQATAVELVQEALRVGHICDPPIPPAD
jgi:hypothetical protein